MADPISVLIPHTRDRAAAESLAEAVTGRADDVSVTIAQTPAETREGFAEADVLLSMHFNDAWYEHLEEIEWLQALYAGVDHLELDRFRQAGVVVTNVSGIHAVPIAQQVVGYMLMFERELIGAVHRQRRHAWERVGGGELGDKTLGVIGLGAIGSQVAQYASEFDMTVIGTRGDPTAGHPIAEAVYGPEETEEVLARADYLVIACPLTEQTRALIDADAIEVLSSSAIVINIARGEIVVEDDLVTALKQGRLGGAALDVFEAEPLPPESDLWELRNVIVTPHMAGSTPHYWERAAEVFADNLAVYREGALEEMPTRVA